MPHFGNSSSLPARATRAILNHASAGTGKGLFIVNKWSAPVATHVLRNTDTSSWSAVGILGSQQKNLSWKTSSTTSNLTRWRLPSRCSMCLYRFNFQRTLSCLLPKVLMSPLHFVPLSPRDVVGLVNEERLQVPLTYIAYSFLFHSNMWYADEKATCPKRYLCILQTAFKPHVKNNSLQVFPSTCYIICSHLSTLIELLLGVKSKSWFFDPKVFLWKGSWFTAEHKRHVKDLQAKKNWTRIVSQNRANTLGILKRKNHHTVEVN